MQRPRRGAISGRGRRRRGEDGDTEFDIDVRNEERRREDDKGRKPKGSKIAARGPEMNESKQSEKSRERERERTSYKVRRQAGPRLDRASRPNQRIFRCEE